MKLVHVIGPKTGHGYQPDAKEEIEPPHRQHRRARPRPGAAHVLFTTWTLRYNRMLWVPLDGLEEHWERASVDADIVDGDGVNDRDARTSPALTLRFAPGLVPAGRRPDKPKVDRSTTAGSQGAPPVLSDRSWTAHFRKKDKAWEAVEKADDGDLRKRHGLQGPIDDAFMDSFLMVRPTGKPLNDKVGDWASAEMKHAIDHWRQAVPRRGARQGRHGRHRRRHRRAQPGPLGRSEQQHGAGEDRRQAADPLGRQTGAARRRDVTPPAITCRC